MNEPGERQPSLWLVLAMPVSLALTVLALVFGLLIGIGLDEGGDAAPTAPPTAQPDGFAEGEEIFASQGCGSCHALAAADATGSVGPSLDGTALTQAEIAGVVANGRGTGMPAFSGRLSDEEVENVAVYVAAASSGSP